MDAPPLGVSPLEKGQRSALAVFNGPLTSSITTSTTATTTTTATAMTTITASTTVTSLVPPPGGVVSNGQGLGLAQGFAPGPGLGLASGQGLASECTINGATPCITPSTMFQSLIGSDMGMGSGVGLAVGDPDITSPGPGASPGSPSAWLFNGLSAQGQGLVLVVDQVTPLSIHPFANLFIVTVPFFFTVQLPSRPLLPPQSLPFLPYH